MDLTEDQVKKLLELRSKLDDQPAKGDPEKSGFPLPIADDHV